MEKSQKSGSTNPNRIEEAVVIGALQKQNINRELFLPLERSRWDGQKLTLGPNADTRDIKSQFVGVRIQTPDPQNMDRSKEQSVQNDLVSLVKSVQELRKNPELAGMVLSKEQLIGKDTGKTARARFGLVSPPNSQFKLNESKAAKECYDQILNAFRKSGYRNESGLPFDETTGFLGLLEWAKQVRLQSTSIKLPSPWWLAALAALLLIPVVCNTCANYELDTQIFGQSVKNDFIIIIDKSSSMDQYFTEVTTQAQKLLNEKIKGGYNCNMDLITYDASAISHFQEIKSIKPDDAGRLVAYLQSLKSSGGTYLKSAIELAAKEVSKHKKKTTLYVFTDGEDGSIQQMIQNSTEIKNLFNGVDFEINMTSPRLLKATQTATPVSKEEEGMALFAKTFNGKFGPN